MDVSIIIPAYNEEAYIAACCNSILDNMKLFNLEYEIIVINNGSVDNTSSIIERIGGISVLEIARSPISSARNRGVVISTGRILAFIDGDVVVNAKWAEALLDLCEGRDEYFLTGAEYLVRSDPTWIEKFWFANLRSDHINAGNLIISRCAFNMLGGFNEELKTGEDYDLCLRAKSANNINYCPDTRFETVHLGYPRNILDFTKRELWHGEGDFANLNVFLNSKVALIAVFYIVVQVLAVFMIVSGHYVATTVLIFGLFFFNLLITALRFKSKDLYLIFVNSLLNYIYFMARFFSLFRALLNKRRKY